MYKMYLISDEGYENVNVEFLTIKTTIEISVNRKMLEVVWVLNTYLI